MRFAQSARLRKFCSSSPHLRLPGRDPPEYLMKNLTEEGYSLTAAGRLLGTDKERTYVLPAGNINTVTPNVQLRGRGCHSLVAWNRSLPLLKWHRWLLADRFPPGWSRVFSLARTHQLLVVVSRLQLDIVADDSDLYRSHREVWSWQQPRTQMIMSLYGHHLGTVFRQPSRPEATCRIHSLPSSVYDRPVSGIPCCALSLSTEGPSDQKVHSTSRGVSRFRFTPRPFHAVGHRVRRDFQTSWMLWCTHAWSRQSSICQIRNTGVNVLVCVQNGSQRRQLGFMIQYRGRRCGAHDYEDIHGHVAFHLHWFWDPGAVVLAWL